MPMPPAQAGGPQPTALTVTMLSRGKGVPEATRAAYNEVRALLEPQRGAYAGTGLRTQRIGLEGEARLCAEFDNPQDAQAALDAIRKRVAGVDLLDVSDTPCPSPKDSTP